ncbi:MAG TPA: carboxypeptidase regulatory-like domain-containing protein, partial [Phycisphaerae bacterium]|nr:carboxypeptidase regulatory-like domain-containing protein [Phycisphaerae bacterium]
SGISVQGSVLDPDGKPVRNAQIVIGPDRYGDLTIPPERTVRSGGFSFAAAPGQQVVVTVLANGYAPELQQFVMGQESPPALVINLQLPHDISGTVVDEHGRPIPNAYITSLRWRDFNTLINNFQTDADGHFDWPGAPVDPVTAMVYAQGYGFDQEVTLTPDHPVVITLKPQQALHFHGIVVNATTGKPIEKFLVAIGTKSANDPTINWFWPDRQIKTYPSGKFDFPETWGPNQPSAYAIRIEANGYLPTESKVYPIADINYNAPLVLKLTPGKDITATVLNPNGKPAAGAEAHLVFTDGQPLYTSIDVDVLDQQAPSIEPYASSYPPVIVSNTGYIDFLPQTGAFKILVFDSSGVALINQDDLNKSSTIQLQPWGVIKGRLFLGNDSVSDQPIYFAIDSHDPNVNIYQSFNYSDIKTDDNGRFEIDYVPPGKWLVCFAITAQAPYSDQNITSPSYPQQIVQISSGEIADVTLGGMGRTVVGHVLLPPDLSSQSGAYYFYSRMTYSKDGPPQDHMPADVKNGSMEKQALWYQSPGGKAFIAAENNYYQQHHDNNAINVRQDGYFIVHGVLPGTYDVSIQMQGSNNVAAYGEALFTMPVIPRGVSDEVLAVPPIQLKTSESYHSLIGNVAPDFSIKTLDGGTLKLSDFHGKYILLSFWGTWDQRYTSEIPQVKSIYKTYSSDNRFVIIGMNVDDTPQPARDYVAKNHLSWLQGYVGSWVNGKTPFMDQQYEVGWVPWYCLIGPDGRIIISDYDIAKIQSTVESVLKQ